MFLTGLFLIAALIAFWAGFRAEPHPGQYLSRAGFVIFLVLAAVAAYFGWREVRTVEELAAVVDPVPGIREVQYVPTPGETSALGEALAAVPGEGGGSTSEARRRLAERARQGRTTYWVLRSRLDPEEVVAFHRRTAPDRGWAVEVAEVPWMRLTGPAGELSIFVTDASPRLGSTVLYGLTPPASDPP